jgi:hypothetical protein
LQAGLARLPKQSDAQSDSAADARDGQLHA